MKLRLDKAMVARQLVPTRSQAESWIRLGRVKVESQVVKKAGQFVSDDQTITLQADEQYVSRAGLKLASVAAVLQLSFEDKVVLDVGSSTGGFTDYALQHGASRVLAVDVGTDQLHKSLRHNPKIELHEKTDIRDYRPSQPIDIVLIDVSFISVREILPHIEAISSSHTEVIVMVKPQFEAGRGQVNKGIVKNDSVRRQVLRGFEGWVKSSFVIIDKADSQVAGAGGNRERFYKLISIVKK